MNKTERILHFIVVAVILIWGVYMTAQWWANPEWSQMQLLQANMPEVGIFGLFILIYVAVNIVKIK